MALLPPVRLHPRSGPGNVLQVAHARRQISVQLHATWRLLRAAGLHRAVPLHGRFNGRHHAGEVGRLDHASDGADRQGLDASQEVQGVS